MNSGKLDQQRRNILSGDTVVDVHSTQRALRHRGIERALGSPSKLRQDRDMLTLREEEVLRWIAWGRSNKEIAASLAISIKTVESYKASATPKLGLRSRSAIMRYALARGWLAEDKSPE